MRYTLKSVSLFGLGNVFFALASGWLYWILTDLPNSGKMALFIFLAAIWAWTFSKIDATLVAILAAIAMWASGITQQQMVLSGLGDPFIAFVIAGFMLGGAYKATGVSRHIAGWFAQHSSTVNQLFYLLTTALLILSFAIPSTSARAALLMPVYLAVASATPLPSVRKALAILFPTIIVLSCVTSYLGAGANLITANLITQFSGETITYTQWLILGAPLGISSCYLSTWVILKLFLTQTERTQAFRFQPELQTEQPNARARQLLVVGTTLGLIALWVSEQWHGINPGMVAIGGATFLCLPQIGVFSFKDALKEVEWSLVLFMAATIELSHGLMDSGVVTYALKHLEQTTQSQTNGVVIAMLITIALLSHLVINSRTARAAVLLPILIPIGISAGQPGLLIAFFANAAMGYCLTLPVCAKPVAMFSTGDQDGFSTPDLLRLSAWLLPLHLILLWLIYHFYLWAF